MHIGTPFEYFPQMLVFLLVIGVPPRSLAVKCVKCEGLDCFGPECEGDYCMIAVYHPKIGGQLTLGEQKVVKGCVTGTLLKESLRDECEKFDEPNGQVQMCLCDDRDLCNHKIFRNEKLQEKTSLVTCQCNECGPSRTTCSGEYCTHSAPTTNAGIGGGADGGDQEGDVLRGCANRSLPLIERKSVGACMTPAMSPNFIRTEIDKGFDRQTCVCAKDYCNMVRPVVPAAGRPQVTCPMYVKMHAVMFKVDRKLGSCQGDHCFDVKIDAHHDSSFFYEAKGCMSYTGGEKERVVHEELHETGCVSFKSSIIDMEACFDEEKGEKKNKEEGKAVPKEPKEGAAVQGPKPGGRPKGRMRRPGHVGRHRQKPKQENKEGAGEKPQEKLNLEPKEELEKAEAGKVAKEGPNGVPKEPPKDLAAAGPAKNKAKVDQAPDNDSNTTLVAVFVIIMVIILLAGLVWKFELHKKIFKARYQTVAG